MIRVPYNKERGYDELLEKIVKDIDFKLNKKEDDFVLLCVGSTGTGKSMLGLHVMETYLGDNADVKFLSLNKNDFAKSLKTAKDSPLPRFCLNDEANISKRDSMSKFNKAVIDLYLSIRGVRIFHWWNNPSLDMIDKHFIEERIKGCILITSKDHNRPRTYYYFTKKGLLKIWEKYGNLKLNLLGKVKKKYAFYRGWFKDYNGKLKKPYLDKKESRMDEKIEKFYNEYHIEDETVSRKNLCDLFGCVSETIKRHEVKLLESGKLEEKDVTTTATGKKRYSKNAVVVIGESIKSSFKNSKENIFKNENK